MVYVVSVLCKPSVTNNGNVTLKLYDKIPIKNWPDPDTPNDIMQALQDNAQAYGLWQQITPMARWEWVRWIRSTGRTETREKRIRVACSKLASGERRPCCWNRNLCTEPSVSKNGVLLSS